MNALTKRILTYVAGNMSSKLISTLLIPIYAYYVTTSDLGFYDYLIVLQNLIIPITFVNIWDAVLKFSMTEQHSKTRNIVFSNSIIVVLTGSIITLLILCLMKINGFLKIKNYLFSFLLLITYGISMFYQYMCRAYQESKLYAISSVVGSIINLLLIFFLVILLDLGYLGLIVAYTVSLFFIIIIIESSLKSYKYFDIQMISFSYIKRMLKLSFPLTINAISLWLTTGISKILVVQYISIEANGIYSFANRFATIINTISSIIGMALIEEAYTYKTISEYSSKFKSIITRLSRYYFSIIGLAVPLISILFILFFFHTAYSESLALIPIFLVSAIISTLSTIVGISFSVVDKTQYICVTSIIGALVNITFGILLVDRFSYYGILAAQLVGNFVMLLSRAFFAYKYTGLSLKWNEFGVAFLVILALGLISVRVNLLSNLIIAFISILIILYVNRSDLFMLQDMIKGRNKNVY